jgi:hypothetical protein
MTVIKSNLACLVEIAEKREGYSALLAEARNAEPSDEWKPRANDSEELTNVSKQYLECFGSSGLRMRFK